MFSAISVLDSWSSRWSWVVAKAWGDSFVEVLGGIACVNKE